MLSEEPAWQLLEQIYKTIAAVLSELPRNSGDGARLALLPDVKQGLALGSVKLKAAELLDEVNADFVFKDEDGFLGVFRAYTSTNEKPWVDTVLEDMRRLTLLRQEQVLTHLVGQDATGGTDLPVRPWTFHLFAVVPDGGFGPLWDDLRTSRLTEEVGLSILVVSQELSQADDLWEQPEIVRFLAPLMLTARTWVHTDWISEWRNQLLRDLSDVLRGHQADDPLASWTANALRQRIADLTAPPQSVEQVSLHSLESLNLRRFRTLPVKLPFGRLVVVYGTNGTGKSSLLEAIELGLTGKLRRFEEVAETQHEDKFRVYEALGNPGGVLKVGVSDTGQFAELPVRPRSDTIWETIGPIFLRQEAMQRFVTMDAEKRYDEMVTLLGIRVTETKEALHGYLLELRKHELSPRWNHSLGKTLPPTCKSYRMAFIGEVQRLLQSALPDLGHLKEMHRLLSELTLSFSLQSAWAKRMENLLNHGMELHSRMSELVHRVLDGLSADEAPSEWVAVLDELHSILDEVGELQSELGRMASTLDELATPVRAARPSVEARLMQLRLMPEAEGELLDHLTQVEAELRNIKSVRQMVEQATKAASTAQQLVTHAVSLQFEITGMDGLASQNWPGRPEDWPDVAEKLLLNLSRVAKEVGGLAQWRGWFEHYHGLLVAQLDTLTQEQKRLTEEVDSLRQRLKHGSFRPSDHDWRPYEKSVRAFASTVGRMVESDLGVADLEAVLNSLTTMEKLIQALREPVAMVELPWRLLEELAHFHERAETPEQCGLLPLLVLADALQERQELVRDCVHAAVERLLGGKVKRLWLEFAWCLTAHNWYQPEPDLQLQKYKTRNWAKVVTPHGPAGAVFNLAEQHILALAWFIVSYMLVGRRYSNTMILDDPFQFMDDVNLTTFLRNFDEVMRVVGAEQLVLAVHQPSVVDYLRHEYGGSEVPEWDAETKGDRMILWGVAVENLDTSTVKVHQFRYRANVPQINITVERDRAIQH